MAPPNVTVNPVIILCSPNAQTVKSITVRNNDLAPAHINNGEEIDKVVFRILDVPDSVVFADGYLEGFIPRGEDVEIVLSRLAAQFPQGNEERLRIQFLRCDSLWDDPPGAWHEHELNHEGGPDAEVTSQDISIRPDPNL